MESITNVRNALFCAFVLAIGAIAVLLFYPFENQWILWSARGVAGLTGFFAAAVIVVFFATYFPADHNDPWKSSYFRYMQNLWGDYKWGGWNRPYKISVCQAVRYTWITLFFWFLFVGALGFLSYHALAIGLGGFEASPFFDVGHSGKTIASDIIGIVLVLGFLGNIMIFVVFKFLFSVPANLSSRADVVFGVWISFLALLTVVVAPIQSFGVAAVGLAVLWIAGVGAGGAFIIWLFCVIVKTLFRTIKSLHHTAPGQLFSELHETLCPEIIEKYIPPKILDPSDA